MGTLKKVGDFFRLAPQTKQADHRGILAPLLAAGDRVSEVGTLFSILTREGAYDALLSGKIKAPHPAQAAAVSAYREYVKDLPSQEQAREKTRPLSSVEDTINAIEGNLHQIEDQYQTIFGPLAEEGGETKVRSSSLVIIGYLEKVDVFSTWLSYLAEHLTLTDDESIPPYRTQSMLAQTHIVAEFAAFNLNRWNPQHDGLLGELRSMHKTGSDIAIQTDGRYVDEFAHDNQFSPMEQELMIASMANPILMMVRGHQNRVQEQIKLLTARKEWLTSKVIFESAKLHGLDSKDPEYRKLQKTVAYYSSVISQYEKKIERMRDAA